MNPKIAVRELTVAVMVCLFLFSYGLGKLGLIGADEPRYAQIAREMLQGHDLVTPTLNGVPWLEKPPLYYWLTVQAYSVFGVKDWAARLPAVFSSLLLIAFLYFFMRRFRPGTQMNTAMITASCAGIIAFSRAVSTDIVLTVSLTLAMLCWWRWLQEKRQTWLYLFYFLLALGALAKGPVAPVLSVLIIVLFGTLIRDWKIALDTVSSGGIAIFLICALPWYLAVQAQNPAFFRVFILEHNVARFTTNLYQHKQPFWYYLPVLALALVPWLVLAIAAVSSAFRTTIAAGTVNQPRDTLRTYLLAWSIVPLVFFSLSQSKLPGYILPAVPAFTLLTADYLDRVRLSRTVMALHSMSMAILAGLVVVAPALLLRDTVRAHAFQAAIVAAVVFGVAYVLLNMSNARGLRLITLGPVIVMVGFLVGPAAGLIDNRFSTRPVAERIQLLAHDGNEGIHEVAVLQAKREVEYGLAYYRNQKISRYERGEIPQSNHILVVGNGFEGEVANYLGSRHRLQIAVFVPQKLAFYWVEAARKP